MTEITSIDSPRRRIEEVMSRRANSAAFYYSDLFRKLSSRAEFNGSELIPPSVDSLVSHLRLTETEGPGLDFQRSLGSAAESVIREEGLSSTIERYSGLPVPLPQQIRDAVAALSREDRRELIKRLLRTPYGPISRIHFIHLLLSFAGESPAYLKLARGIAAGLLSPQGAEEFEAFMAILRWTDEEIGSVEKGSRSSQLRLALVWTHSHRLYTILMASEAPVSWIQQTFSTTERPVSLDMFERDSDYWFDVANPRRISCITFLLGALSSGVGGHATKLMDQRLKDLLDSAAFSEKDGAKVPDFSLFKDQGQLGNTTGSFLGGDRGEQVSQLLGLDFENILTRTSLQRSMNQAVTRLTEARDDLEAWASLFTIVGDSPPNENLIDPLKSIIEQTDFADLAKRDAQLGILALHTASMLVVHIGDDTLRQHLKSELVRIAQIFGQGNFVGDPSNSDNSDGPHRAGTLVSLMPDLALNLSLALRDPENTITEFVDIMAQLVEVSREVGTRVWIVIQKLCEELPVSDSQEFWPLLVGIRATTAVGPR